MSGNIYNQLAVTTLADGRLQLWTVNDNLGLISCQQQSPDPNSSWTPLTAFPMPQAEVVTFTAAPLSDGRVQLFAIDGSNSGQIWSTWQETMNPNTAWTAWSPSLTPEKGAYAVTAASLDDGRLQLFVADTAGQIWSTRQQSTDPNSGWTPLASVPAPQTRARFVAASSLSDKRLQLFLLDEEGLGLIWSTHQQTPDADAAWLPPSPFQTPQGGVYLLAVGSLSDKSLYLFLTDNQGQFWGTYQQTTQHDTSWSPLSPMPKGPGRSLATALLSDGRLQLFAGDGTGQGQIASTHQQTTDPNSGWTPFGQLS